MFFEVSKIVGFFLLPSNFLIVLGLAGLVLLTTRWRRAGWWLAVSSLILLAAAGFSPLGNALLLPLEQRFPPADHDRAQVDGIVVLGGAVSPEISARRGSIALNESAERMTEVAVLARRHPRARIVFTGGSGTLFADSPSEAQFAAALFESFGIERSRILLEDKSRNTAENARFTKALVNPQSGERWLLVTSAHHMPRSIGAFRAAGFPVEAAPVDWRTRGTQDLVWPFGSLGDGLKRTDTAMHEWAGLIGYRLTGRTAELLPSP